MTVNGITGSKEVANLLHKCGHEISYADIRHLNKSWANEVTTNTNQIFLSTFPSGKSIHVAIDNSDGKQQTTTGSNKPTNTNQIFLSTFPSGKSIHVAIDNSDGKQQTTTGSNKRHTSQMVWHFNYTPAILQK